MDFKNLIYVIDLSTIFFFSLIWVGAITFLRLKKKKSLVYILFFTIFFIYVYKVLDYTLFQYQSLLLLRYFTPELMLNGQAAGKSLNLIPLITLTVEDLKTSLLNILLLMPFGFGLPFITHFRMKKIVIFGAFFSFALEFLQLMSGLMTHITFRVADINDVLFNTLGAAIGYILFVSFIYVYRRVSRNWKISKNPILQYIAKRLQVETEC